MMQYIHRSTGSIAIQLMNCIMALVTITSPSIAAPSAHPHFFPDPNARAMDGHDPIIRSLTNRHITTYPVQPADTSLNEWSTGVIHLNQVGFYPQAQKIAVLTAVPASDSFYVISQQKDIVFSGKIGPAKKSRNSSLICYTADFSAFTKPGTYQLYLLGVGHSYPFTIAAQILQQPGIAALKAFFFQRVSEPLSEQFAGRWARPAGHPDDQVQIHPSAASSARPTGTFISSPGGWYDAGDYNKYIVNSGITTATLLSAYEDFPNCFKNLRTGIPESSNDLPDILDEVLVNLRWMHTMQDPNDGGVYHKLTNANFDGMVMPGVTKLPRYIVQKSTAAALDFAAVMAQATRIFRSFSKQLPGLADSSQKAAERAWEWAVQNPDVIYRQEENNKIFPPAITTGTYGDGEIQDEWFWAAAELLSTTGKEKYARELITQQNRKLRTGFWQHVEMLGVFTLVKHQQSLPKWFAKDHLPIWQNRLQHFADSLLTNIPTNAFGTVMGGSPKDFEWGSNAVAANQGITLLNAFLLTKKSQYLDGALSNADHILGRNATGYCFLTGWGSRSPMRPHHRPSVADGIPEPVPGLLCGGPNPGRQDGCTYLFTEPETCFLDDDCSYASNEIAINWNAPLVYLLLGIDHLNESPKKKR